jgi:hypothetical protein
MASIRSLLALGERLQAPMVHAMRGKERVDGTTPTTSA